MHQTYREQTWGETDFALFFQQYASPLLDYLRLRTRTLEDAEDILVDVFMAARQTPQIAQEQPGGKLAWLRQVARNKMVDYYRRQNRQMPVLPLEALASVADQHMDSNPEAVFVQSEMLAHLQTVIRTLTEQQQELLRLRFHEGLRCPQIASRMGKREGAIRTMLVRTLQTLRSMYHPNREELL